MVQKAVHSKSSSPNSLGPKRDWPEVRGEECHPRAVLSWLLVKWVVGESEEAGCHTLSSHGSENPLSLRKWKQKQNETEDSPPEQPRLGDGGIEKACLVDVLHLCQVEPEMALLDHHGGHRL